MKEITLQAERADRGLRMDVFLAGKLEDMSRSQIQRLIKAGEVLLDGQPVTPRQPVKEGDRLTILIPEPQAWEGIRAEEMPLDVLYEDDDIIVLNKPAGLVMHPGAGVREGTLASGLLHHCGSLSVIGGVERPGIVHRLDKETSGCLVVAKNDASHAELSRQFAAREVRKTYLAVVQGVPRRRQGVIDVPIERHPVHRKKMRAGSRGREAVTAYRLLATRDGISLIECHPRTGRTHQIRVHLKHIGLPILGDAVYGRRGSYSRHLLHAQRLEFTHPRTGQRMAFEAPLPPDFPRLMDDASRAE